VYPELPAATQRLEEVQLTESIERVESMSVAVPHAPVYLAA
jgi:hypothetical protein